MKKIFILVLLFTIFISTTYSSDRKQSIGNIVISTDPFAGTQSIEYKARKLDAVFTKGTNSSLNFEPSFVLNTENDTVTIWLKVKFTSYTKLLDSRYEKIIFLSDKGRLTIHLNSSLQNPELIYTNKLFGDQCSTICNIQISKEEYLKFNEYILSIQLL